LQRGCSRRRQPAGPESGKRRQNHRSRVARLRRALPEFHPFRRPVQRGRAAGMSYQGGNSSPAYERLGGWGVKTIVAELQAARERWRAAQQRSLEFAVREFPSREALKAIANDLFGALFPMRLGPAELHQEGEDFYVGHTLDSALNALFLQVQLEL